MPVYFGSSLTLYPSGDIPARGRVRVIMKNDLCNLPDLNCNYRGISFIMPYRWYESIDDIAEEAQTILSNTWNCTVSNAEVRSNMRTGVLYISNLRDWGRRPSTIIVSVLGQNILIYPRVINEILVGETVGVVDVNWANMRPVARGSSGVNINVDDMAIEVIEDKW